MCKVKVDQPENLVQYVLEKKGRLTTWDGYPVEALGLIKEIDFKTGQTEAKLKVRFKDTNGKWHHATCDKDGVYLQPGKAFFTADVSFELRRKISEERTKGYINVYLKPGSGLHYYWYPTQEDADKSARSAKSQRLACIVYKGTDILSQ